MSQTLFNSSVSPFRNFCFALSFGAVFDGLRKIYESFSRIRAAIQKHVFHVLKQFLVDLVIHFQLAGIHNAHVQPGVDRVIQKRCVDGFANNIVATK